MAEGDSVEFEVKDEELVDFEGSDYGFGSDEELDTEESVKEGGEAGSQVHVASSEGGGQCKATTGDGHVSAQLGTQGAKDGTESGEIREEKEDKEEGVVMQPASARGEGGSHGVGGSRYRKHRKADLEDGELDDGAMHEGSDREAEGNLNEDEEDSTNRQERKRRKDRFAPERQVSDIDKKDRREAEQVSGSAVRHSRGRGSDRHLDRSRNHSKSLGGGRGTSHEATASVPYNNQAGIMGPGRLFVPADLAMQLRPFGRGFVGPVGNAYLPGRPSLHMQEALAQEQMFRSQRIMQFAHASANGPSRPSSLSGHLGPPPMPPLPALEFGPLPQGLMQWQSLGPDLMHQINLMSSIDNYARNPRPFVPGRGVAGMFGVTPGSPDRNMGRQVSWSGVPMSNDAQQGGAGRGRGQGRGQMIGPVWGEPHPGTVVGQALVGVMNVGQGMNMGQGMVAVPSTPQGSGQGLSDGQSQGLGHVLDQDAKQGYPQAAGHGSGVSQASVRVPQVPKPGQSLVSGGSSRSSRGGANGSSKREAKSESSSRVSNDIRPEDDRRYKRVSSLKSDVRSENAVIAHPRQGRENRLEKRHSGNSVPSGPGNGGPIANGSLSTLASNLIQLGGPVHKSRVLTVSGLPDNTSMTAIVEAFEKQGKITDFKKEGRGDTFTITFASLSEAISAKRHLHRSVMGGHQITVEYAVARG